MRAHQNGRQTIQVFKFTQGNGIEFEYKGKEVILLLSLCFSHKETSLLFIISTYSFLKLLQKFTSEDYPLTILTQKTELTFLLRGSEAK